MIGGGVVRRVVITGIGVVAPGGSDAKAFWELVSSGRPAVREITLFDASGYRSRVAAEADFDPVDHGLSLREVRRMDRAAQMAVVAAREAVGDCGLVDAGIAEDRVGVVIGSAVGCSMSLEREYAVVSDRGREWLVDHAYTSPHLYGQFVPSSLAAEVAWAVGAQGPVTVVSDGCTSGLDALGYAAELVREGRVDAVVAGGTEAPISPITVACFDAIKATTPRNDDPEHASRPFDRTRNGFVLGEGAAVLVLEEYTAARRRGAFVYAEIAGYANRGNAYHMTGLRADGAEMAEAIGAAMAQAGTVPADIGYVNAHGSGTKQNDRHETAAVKRALGEHAYAVPMSSIKSMIGHSLGAIGALEIACCALAIQHGVLPPTANLNEPDPDCDLDYIPLVARHKQVDAVLSVGSGFGGFQSAMVLTRPGGRTA
ncbi:beta-ketoacyl-[acyl-carrier-protein] synthase family protein [Streptantibioticus silvisoli]|uniref:Beta-ketoacyl-[acyl-carrier-protein] synthase family protein n=1 Tax=Streptantibioticus silvisoli TaxID=2705255 RepID=A0ABT6VY98_9ACTN|nr:beta-ketoacyl-[acyl-carrier-protein] synthase family protein [Streptantibioticus silvisoli]MDI5963462.1 beta-ketoacyl-[acyl-carrier-protein] synthase family protein [Streptantibioticus silvisoli]